MLARLSLNEKIVLSFVALLLGVMGVLFAAERVLVAPSVMQMMRSDLQASVASLDRIREVESGAALQKAAVIADAPKLIASVATRDPETVRNTLASWPSKRGFIMVVDRQGRQLAALAPTALPAELGDRPGVQEALAGKSSLAWWNQQGTLWRVAAAPIVQGGDTLIGALLVGEPVDRAWCEQIGELTRSKVALLADGRVSVATVDEGALPVSGLESGHLTPIDGVPHLVETRLLSKDGGITLVLLRSLGPYGEAESRTQLLFAGTAVVTVLLALLLGWRLSRNITDPLRRLIASLTLDAGARPPRVHLESSDRDVAHLESSFNALSDALERSLLAWENSFDSVSEGLFVLDERDCVTRTNRSADAIVRGLGVDAAAFVHWMRFGVDAPCPACPHAAAAEAVREVGWKDSERSFLLTQAPLQGERGVVVAALEITDLVKMRVQVSQQEKLAVLGQTMASVTHELNNPLTSILGHAELLGERIDDPSLRADLDRLSLDAQRAAQVVRNMLTFARQRKPELIPVDPRQLLTECVSLRQRSLEKSRVEAAVEVDGQVAAVLADPYQLQQVIINLVVNAEQALVEARTVSPRITLRARQRGRRVFLQIEDNGPGLPEGLLPRLFDPFFTTKSAGKGTGLGLSICQTIASQHGGTLIAGNGVGGGAVFVLQLPASDRPVVAPPTPKAMAPAAAGTGSRVLLVDDEPSITSIVTRVLQRMGHEVEVVTSGAQALERLEGGKYDLVISDLHMPEMSGEDLYAEVKRRWPALTRRMMYMTGDILSEDTRVFLESLENPYLLKPFKVDEVRRTIGGVLEAIRATTPR